MEPVAPTVESGESDQFHCRQPVHVKQHCPACEPPPHVSTAVEQGITLIDMAPVTDSDIRRKSSVGPWFMAPPAREQQVS
jgi:hypothetical protein